MKRVLLVEDEENLRKVIKLNLKIENFEVIEATDGVMAQKKLSQEHFDIMILDLMLPELSGMDVLKFTQLNNLSIPTIITSAKDSSSDRINGLKEGADDYLTKPFEIEELLLRMNNLLRRSNKESAAIETTFVFGPNKVNFKSWQASRHDHSFELSQKEIQILRLLITRKNEIVSRQDILKNVWGYDVFPSTRTVDNFISSLRKHFEDDPKSPDFIKSVRGVGYMFVVNE